LLFKLLCFIIVLLTFKKTGMFCAKNKEIKEISREEKGEKIVNELKELLEGNVNMYIDYANVRPWANYLNWHIDLKRLSLFLNSFKNINQTKIYSGTLIGDEKSERIIKEINKAGYILKTKPVKIMRFSIDASSISPQSTNLLNQFIRTSLIRKYDIATIEYLNNKFRELNNQGTYFLEDRKCNFDVEIGRDILIDHEKNNINTFVLWSGDSDFSEPLAHLLEHGKKVILFATSKRISTELNALREKGLLIFDIRKIKNFICWRRELKQN